ncbi:TPA: response regulator [Candidatus Poribacteria bacterium]|nr:response regulator [Candidatus Poribacteria bacterium]
MLKKEQILVVDDDVLMCKSLCGAIRRKGYKVEAVNSGSEALEKLYSQKATVVISDIKMPEMSGLELLNQIKELSP